MVILNIWSYDVYTNPMAVPCAVVPNVRVIDTRLYIGEQPKAKIKSD